MDSSKHWSFQDEWYSGSNSHTGPQVVLGTSDPVHLSDMLLGLSFTPLPWKSDGPPPSVQPPAQMACGKWQRLPQLPHH